MTVYFDNAATTCVRPEAAEIILRMLTEKYGNPSSTHRMGREAKTELNAARKKIADVICAKPEEIYFTSGGTEADNLALLGSCEQTKHFGKHVITTTIEHDAIGKTAEKLSSMGWEITYVKPDITGRISAQDVKNSLRPDTVLVSVMLVNNETGAVNPVREIADVIRESGSRALLHTDAVQGFCKIPFTVKSLGADMVSLSSHKIHGPKGSGALYIRSGVKIKSIFTGGGQENGIRSGTEALPNIAGFGEAARLGGLEMTQSIENMRSLRTYIADTLRKKLPECVIIGEGDAPHILCLSLPGYRSEVLMNYLEAENIFVSKGSACKRGARSHVLTAMNLPAAVIDGAIRLSFSKYSTMEEADVFVEKISAAASCLAKAK